MKTLFTALILCMTMPVMADIKLYVCVQDGMTIMQDKPIESCQDMHVYEYDAAKQTTSVEPLRKGEVKALQELDRMQEARIKRYENVDERVGDSLFLRERDRVFDQCLFFRGAIETTLIDIDRRPVDSLFVRQASRSLVRDHSQYIYYCGQAYPGLEDFIEALDSRI